MCVVRSRPRELSPPGERLLSDGAATYRQEGGSETSVPVEKLAPADRGMHGKG